MNIQLIATANVISTAWSGPLKPGDVLWLRSLEAARHLIEAGLCKWPEVEEKPPVVVDPEMPHYEQRRLIMRRPDGWPIDRFAVIEPAWKGDTVLCVGGGPSVTQDAVNLAKGKCRVIVVNDAYLLAPWADIHYFADGSWWGWHKDKPEYRSFEGQRVTIENTGMMVADPNVFMLHNYGTEGLSERQNGLHTGQNGGYQVINIAALSGAMRILLLGYDMRFNKDKSHWHCGHPVKTPEQSYARYARNFKSMLPQLKRLGVEVINCTPGSLIQCFPFSTIEKELCAPTA